MIVKLWSIAAPTSPDATHSPIPMNVVRGLVALWTGSTQTSADTQAAAAFLIGLHDQGCHLACGCRGEDPHRAPRLLCKKIRLTRTVFLCRDTTRPEHAESCIFRRDSRSDVDHEAAQRAERTARQYDLADLLSGTGGVIVQRARSPEWARPRALQDSHGQLTPPTIATALDLLLEASGANAAHVPYPHTPEGHRIFPEQSILEATSRVSHQDTAAYTLDSLFLVQPSSLEGFERVTYEHAAAGWRGDGAPVGYAMFVCDDILQAGSGSLLRYRGGEQNGEVLVAHRIPCARANVSGPYLVLCKIGHPAGRQAPCILAATSQAVASRSDWWAVDSEWERESYQNLRRILKEATEEGLQLEAWRPLRWLTAVPSGLFLPDWWLRCRSSWGCWHNLFGEVEGTRDADGREMKERTIQRAETRGRVWRDDRRDGRRQQADRRQRSAVLAWARWASKAEPQANSDFEEAALAGGIVRAPLR